MKSVIIRLVIGLVLLAVGLGIFLSTLDVYPYTGCYVYECSLCGKQWNEFVMLDDRVSCPNYAKVVNETTGKKEYVCRVKLCAVGVEDKKAVGNYIYVGKVIGPLIVNTVGGVLAIAGLFVMGITGYRYLLTRPKKSDED